jgi:phage tail sheath protein FI
MQTDPKVMSIEHHVKQMMQAYLFDENAEKLWTALKIEISDYLAKMWSNGELRGARASDAYRVEVGPPALPKKDTPTPPTKVFRANAPAEAVNEEVPEQVEVGDKLIIDIMVAVVRPAEFIHLNFEQTQQSA